ncbi:MAG: histidine phosphatase family protein [Planctomycetota bacterium]|nr:MAG: histidine phosphatase family protein [Planctomycetota bacterium]
MKLYCVRHGETTYNLARRIQGQLDSELSPLGRKQCVAVTEALAGVPLDAVISSPLRRARESAQGIADALQLQIELEPRLMEINAGIFQGHCWHQLDEQFPEAAASWRSQDPDFRIPEGESRRDLMTRAAEAFRAIRQLPYQNVLVVAHGGSLTAAFKALLEIPARHNPFELNNGSISLVDWQRDFKLLSLNQTSHLHGLDSGGGDL